MNVSLTPTLEKLVQQKVESGLYNNASEVIREALRLMKETDEIRRMRLKKLKAALAQGEADIAAGRLVRLQNESDVEAFFSDL